MSKFKKSTADSVVETKEHEQIVEEARQPQYNIYKANEETVRICLENEKKTPIPIPDDHESYFNKLFGIR